MSKTVPIIRREYLSDGSILSKVIGKETLNVSVDLKPDTQKVIYWTVGGIATAILAHAIIRKF